MRLRFPDLPKSVSLIMRVALVSLVALSFLSLSACDRAAPKAAPAGAELTTKEIAWRAGDVDDAFAEAAGSGKLVLLYWGATWCPPCDRLKAGLFQDPEFIARTTAFVPVYLDGDSKGAQAWGERFAIKGYPTLIVLGADRNEITRLSSGDPAQVEAALEAVQKSRRPVKALLEQALSKPRGLKRDDWAVLAGYSWDQDDGRLAPADQAAQVLSRLSDVAPTPALKRRFTLLSLELLPESASLAGGQKAKARDTLNAVLASPEEARANLQTLAFSGDRLVKLASSDAGERARLSALAVQAADRLYTDESLGLSDRLVVTNVDITLFRASAGKDAAAPPALVNKVRERAAWADRTATTAYERQAAISTAADLLSEVGDKTAAEQLSPAHAPAVRRARQGLERLEPRQWRRRGAREAARPHRLQLRGTDRPRGPQSLSGLAPDGIGPAGRDHDVLETHVPGRRGDAGGGAGRVARRALRRVIDALHPGGGQRRSRDGRLRAVDATGAVAGRAGGGGTGRPRSRALDGGVRSGVRPDSGSRLDQRRPAPRAQRACRGRRPAREPPLLVSVRGSGIPERNRPLAQHAASRR